MKALEQMILKEGRLLPGDILKVDKFLNHMIDPELFTKMGEDFYNRFKDKNITKILTLEVSGIAIAFAAAQYFKVPVLFAKKMQSLTLGNDVYTSKVISYTKKKEFDIMISKSFLNEGENVLIIDDFLANGEALKGLIDLCNQAKANVSAIGIAIEKVFQQGGNKFREKGYEIYSQAMIEKFSDGKVIFASREK